MASHNLSGSKERFLQVVSYVLKEGGRRRGWLAGNMDRRSRCYVFVRGVEQNQAEMGKL